MINYADLITSERTGRGWTMEELAKRAHVSRSTVYKLEHGYSSSFDVVKAVLEALEYEIEVKRKGQVMRW